MRTRSAGQVEGIIREEVGATAVEYAVMLALILVVAAIAITAFGNGLASRWRTNVEKISGTSASSTSSSNSPPPEPAAPSNSDGSDGAGITPG